MLMLILWVAYVSVSYSNTLLVKFFKQLSHLLIINKKKNLKK